LEHRPQAIQIQQAGTGDAIVRSPRLKRPPASTGGVSMAEPKKNSRSTGGTESAP